MIGGNQGEGAGCGNINNSKRQNERGEFETYTGNRETTGQARKTGKDRVEDDGNEQKKEQGGRKREARGEEQKRRKGLEGRGRA